MADRDVLDQRLLAYEACLPDADPPDLDRAPQPRSRTLLTAILALGAVAGVLLAFVLLVRPTPPVGQPSPMPSASLSRCGPPLIERDDASRLAVESVGSAHEAGTVTEVVSLEHGCMSEFLDSNTQIPGSGGRGVWAVVLAGTFLGECVIGADGSDRCPPEVDSARVLLDGRTGELLLFEAPWPSFATGDWGPLTVIEATGDFARNVGILRIADPCVFLEGVDGAPALLVWPADQTAWNPADGTISFTTLGGEDLTLASGDQLTLGGGGWSSIEDGQDPREWAAGIEWTNAPNDACLTDVAWFVTDVVPTVAPTPTPEPSPAAWVPLPFPADIGEYASLHGVTEWDGHLVAVGRAGERLGAIWVSDDGATWRQATVPDAPPELAVSLQAPFVVDERLFVIGITFYPAGSGPVGSVIWTSTDGLTWTDTAASGLFTGSPLGVIGVRGQTIVAAERHELPSGSAFWLSEDAGATWQRSAFDMEGSWATSGLVHDGTFTAVGATYTASPSDGTASVWTSADGLAWAKTELGPGYASRIAELPDGTLLVIGGNAGDSEITALGWTSIDGGEWTPSDIDLACCGTEFDVTPSGLVAVQRAEDGSTSMVSTSRDGLNWSLDGPLAGDMRGVRWTDAFGIVIWGVDPNGTPSVIVGWEAQ